MDELSFQKNQRVGIFIDTQNLYHSARMNFNAHVNYRAMIDTAVHGRQLIRAFAYVIRSEAGDELKFFDALSDIGIEMRVKDLQVFYSGEKKADWDVGIAIDIVRMTEKLDAVVLISGDGDFVEVLRYVKSRGVRAEVMAFRKTTSAKLMEEVDTFYDLGGDSGKFLIPIGGGRPMMGRKTSRTQPASNSSVRPPASAGVVRPSVARPMVKPIKSARPLPKIRPLLKNVSKYSQNG